MKHPLCTQTQLHTYCRLRHTSVHLVNGSRLELCSTLSSATQYDDQIHRVSFFFVFVILALLALTEKEQWSFLSGLWEKKKKKTTFQSLQLHLKVPKKSYTQNICLGIESLALSCAGLQLLNTTKHVETHKLTQVTFFFFFFPTAHFSKN